MKEENDDKEVTDERSASLETERLRALVIADSRGDREDREDRGDLEVIRGELLVSDDENEEDEEEDHEKSRRVSSSLAS